MNPYKEMPSASEQASTKLAKVLDSRNGLATAETCEAGGVYVLTQDLASILNDGTLCTVGMLAVEIDTFAASVAKALSRAYPKNTIALTREAPFYTAITQMANEEAKKQDAIIINVDRYIVNVDPTVNARWYSLSIGRMITSTGQEVLATRPNTRSLNRQIDIINDGLPDSRRVIFVDDGFSSPEALEPYLRIAKLNKWDIAGFVVGVCPDKRGEWAATRKVAEAVSGNPVRAALPVTDPVEWTNIRDFTLFGGLMIEGVDMPLLAPYILPFSNGSKASIPQDNLITISRDVLEANVRLMTAINVARQSPLTFAQLQKSGYGLPTSTLDIIRAPQPEESVLSYITAIQQSV